MTKKLFLFLLFAFIILNIGLGSWGLTESSEARYAEIGREMLFSKNYINPTLLGIYHYDKPPVTYWLTLLSYKIFGVNEFSARFFLQIAIILQLLLVYKIAQLLFANRKISLLSALIYFSLPIVLVASRNLTTDAYLTTFIMAAIYFWLVRIRRFYGVWSLYAFYFFTAIAILTKGPVALLFILIFIITYHSILKRKIETSIHGILGFLLFLGVSLSWFIILLISNTEFFNYFLGHQLSDRIFSNSFNRGKPFYYFILLLPIFLFPWWFLLFGTTKKKIAQFFKRKDDSTVLMISSIVLILLFSFFKTKLILYILPTFWMLAILIAKKLVSVNVKMLKTLDISYAILCILIPVACVVFYFVAIPTVTISLWQVIFAILLALLWFGVYFKLKETVAFKTAILSVGFSVVLLISGMFFMKNNDGEINSIKAVATFVEKINPAPEKSVLVYNNLLNSAPFYINANIITINNGYYTAQRNIKFQKNEKWKKNLIDFKDASQKPYLDSLVKNSRNILLVRKKGFKDEEIQPLLSKFENKKVFENWIVCYH